MLIVYRIDSGKMFSKFSSELGYYATKEIAEEVLKRNGFYLEKRKWCRTVGHEPGSTKELWYDKKLSENGFFEEDTSCAYITEVEIKYLCA